MRDVAKVSIIVPTYNVEMYLEECMEQQRSPDDITAENELSAEALTEVSKILLENASNSAQDSMQAYKDSINVLQLKGLKIRHSKLMEAIKEISTSNPNYTKNPDYIEKMKQSLVIRKKIEKLKFI